MLVDVDAHGECGPMDWAALAHEPVLHIGPELVQHHQRILGQHFSQLERFLVSSLPLLLNHTAQRAVNGFGGVKRRVMNVMLVA